MPEGCSPGSTKGAFLAAAAALQHTDGSDRMCLSRDDLTHAAAILNKKPLLGWQLPVEPSACLRLSNNHHGVYGKGGDDGKPRSG